MGGNTFVSGSMFFQNGLNCCQSARRALPLKFPYVFNACSDLNYHSHSPIHKLRVYNC